jgi:hypothetical protein
MRPIEVEFHRELNPRLWQANRLLPRVRRQLIVIARDFVAYTKQQFPVADIVVAGGQANYTYTPHSDLDLHLVVAFDRLRCGDELRDLLDTVRLRYNDKFAISVLGIPVELFVEDTGSPPVSAAYSVLTDRWLRPPSKKMPQFDRKSVEKRVILFQKLLKQAEKHGDCDSLQRVLQLLSRYRKISLKMAGTEFAEGNLVYKILRNRGLLAGARLRWQQLKGRELSIQ